MGLGLVRVELGEREREIGSNADTHNSKAHEQTRSLSLSHTQRDQR